MIVTSIIANSDDWKIEMILDMDGMSLSPELAVIPLCPDVIAVSQKLKVVRVIEITIIPKQHEYKFNKNADLSSNIR